MANRAFTLDELTDYYARQYYDNTLDEEIVPAEIDYSSASVELRESFLKELILSGELDRMTSDLMWRLAARCAGKESTPDAILAEERRFLHRNGLESAQLANRLEQLNRH